MDKLQKYCLSLVLLCVFGCSTTSQEQSKKALHMARFAHQGTSQNMNALAFAIEKDSSNHHAFREMSIPYLKRGMPHKWKPLFDQAEKLDPKTWVPLRGYLYLMFYRDYQKAINYFNATDSLTPHLDHPQGHSVDYWRGIAYLGLKNYPKAIAFFNQHIAKETQETGEDWVELEAFLYRGIAHYKIENYEQAIFNFKKIEQHFKHSAEAYFYWAKCLMALEKPQEASQLLDKATQDLAQGLHLNHVYVAMPHQIYPADIAELKARLKPKN